MIAWYSSGSMEFFHSSNHFWEFSHASSKAEIVRDVGWVVGVWLRCGLFCANPLRLLDDRLYLFPDPSPVFLFFFRVGVGCRDGDLGLF